MFWFENGFPGFHSREVFPSHREVAITVNTQSDRFTGTSGLDRDISILEIK